MSYFLLNILIISFISMIISIIFITPRKAISKFAFSNTKHFRKEFIFFPIVIILLYTILGVASKTINTISQPLLIFMLLFTMLVGLRIWKPND